MSGSEAPPLSFVALAVSLTQPGIAAAIRPALQVLKGASNNPMAPSIVRDPGGASWAIRSLARVEVLGEDLPEAASKEGPLQRFPENRPRVWMGLRTWMDWESSQVLHLLMSECCDWPRQALRVQGAASLIRAAPSRPCHLLPPCPTPRALETPRCRGAFAEPCATAKASMQLQQPWQQKHQRGPSLRLSKTIPGGPG